jgi:serine phosphatase RsbU (regulator of sigma subunit)
MKEKRSFQNRLLFIAIILIFLTTVAIYSSNLFIFYRNISNMVVDNNIIIAKLGRTKINGLIKSMEQIISLAEVNPEVLKQVVSKNRLISLVMVVNNNGKIIDSHPQLENGKDILNQSNINFADLEKVVWSSGFYLEEMDGKFLMVALPGESRTIVSLIGLDKFNRFIKNIEVGKNYKINIYDKSGNLIAGTDYSLSEKSFTNNKDYIPVKKGLEGEETSFYRGDEFLTSTVIIHDTGWVVSRSIARDAAFAPFRETLYNTVIILIIIIFLVYFIAKKFFRHTFQPLNYLVEQMKKVNRGKYSKIKFRNMRFVELEFLQDKFKDMVTIVQKRENELKSFSQKLKQKNKKLNNTKEKLDNQLEKGRKLHESFLPTEKIESDLIEIDTYYRPSEKLGGDFYNIIDTDRYIISYIVDITGHGLDGAFLNIFVRQTINSYLIHHQDEKLKPAKIMKYILEQYRKESIPDDYFICLMLVVIDRENAKMSFSNAGIQFPLLSIQDNEIKEYFIKELPLSNAIPEESYSFEEKEIAIGNDDLFFLTTDGLIEERVDGKSYGWERLKNLIIASKDQDQELKNIIISDFEDFTGYKQGSDDITFMILRTK